MAARARGRACPRRGRARQRCGRRRASSWPRRTARDASCSPSTGSPRAVARRRERRRVLRREVDGHALGDRRRRVTRAPTRATSARRTSSGSAPRSPQAPATSPRRRKQQLAQRADGRLSLSCSSFPERRAELRRAGQLGRCRCFEQRLLHGGVWLCSGPPAPPATPDRELDARTSISSLTALRQRRCDGSAPPLGRAVGSAGTSARRRRVIRRTSCNWCRGASVAASAAAPALEAPTGGNSALRVRARQSPPLRGRRPRSHATRGGQIAGGASQAARRRRRRRAAAPPRPKPTTPARRRLRRRLRRGGLRADGRRTTRSRRWRARRPDAAPRAHARRRCGGADSSSWRGRLIRRRGRGEKPHGEGELLLADGSVPPARSSPAADGTGLLRSEGDRARRPVGGEQARRPLRRRRADVDRVGDVRRRQARVAVELGDEAARRRRQRAVRCRTRCLFHGTTIAAGRTSSRGSARSGTTPSSPTAALAAAAPSRSATPVATWRFTRRGSRNLI